MIIWSSYSAMEWSRLEDTFQIRLVQSSMPRRGSPWAGCPGQCPIWIWAFPGMETAELILANYECFITLRRFSPFQLVHITSCLTTGPHWEESDSTFFTSPIKFLQAISFSDQESPHLQPSHLPKHIWHFYISSTKLFPVPDFPSSLRVQALLNVVLRTFLSGKTKEKKAIPLFCSKKCIEVKLCFLFLEKYVFYMAANKNQEQKY